MTAAQTVIDAINDVTFGPHTQFRNLTMAPIVVGADRHPDYLTLDEALAERLAGGRVIHVSASPVDIQ